MHFFKIELHFVENQYEFKNKFYAVHQILKRPLFLQSPDTCQNVWNLNSKEKPNQMLCIQNFNQLIVSDEISGSIRSVSPIICQTAFL